MRIDWDRYLPREESSLAIKLVVGALLVSWASGLAAQVSFLLTLAPGAFGDAGDWLSDPARVVPLLGVSTLLAFAVMALLLKRFRFPRSLWAVVALSALLTAVVGIAADLADSGLFKLAAPAAGGLSLGRPALAIVSNYVRGGVPEFLAALLVVALLIRAPREPVAEESSDQPHDEAAAEPADETEASRDLDDEDDRLADWSGIARRLRLPTAAIAFPPNERFMAVWVAALPALVGIMRFLLRLPGSWAQYSSISGDSFGLGYATASIMVAFVLSSFLAVYVSLRAFHAPRSIWLAVAVPTALGVLLSPLSMIQTLLSGIPLAQIVPLALLSAFLGVILAITPFGAAVAAARWRVEFVVGGVALAVIAMLALAFVLPVRSGAADSSSLQFPEAMSKAFPGFASDADVQDSEDAEGDSPDAPTSFLFTIERAGVARAVFASDIEMEEDGNEYLPVQTDGKELFVRDDYFIDQPESRFAKTPFERRRALWDAVAKDTSGQPAALPPATSDEVEQAPRQRVILAIFADPGSLPTRDLVPFGYVPKQLAGATVVAWSDYSNEELAAIASAERGIPDAADYVQELNEESFGAGGWNGYRFGVLVYRWQAGKWQRIQPTK